MSGLEETVSAQSTRIAHLSTQVAGQEQTNINQEKNISHLYTQKPFALEIITSVPAGAPHHTISHAGLVDGGNNHILGKYL